MNCYGWVCTITQHTHHHRQHRQSGKTRSNTKRKQKQMQQQQNNRQQARSKVRVETGHRKKRRKKGIPDNNRQKTGRSVSEHAENQDTFLHISSTSYYLLYFVSVSRTYCPVSIQVVSWFLPQHPLLFLDSCHATVHQSVIGSHTHHTHIHAY